MSLPSMEDDEEGFLAYLTHERKLTLVEVRKSRDPAREKTLRSDYREFLADAKSQLKPQATSGLVRRREVEALYVNKYVDADELRRMARSGEIGRIARMSARDRERRFGSTALPIFVPLARGESPEQYEHRFQMWLENSEGITFQELQSHHCPREELHYRIKFAQLNGKGLVKPTEKRSSNSDAPQPEHEDRLFLCKRPKIDTSDLTERLPPNVVTPTPPSTPCSGRETIANCVSCGCRVCLSVGLRLLATRIGGLNTMGKKRSRVDSSDDSIDRKLLADYNAVNAEVVANEAALASSEAALASVPVSDIKEIVQIQEENAEMQRLLQEERVHRTKALACVILYAWRHDVDGLVTMIRYEDAADSNHIQRLLHQQCLAVGVALAHKHQRRDQQQDNSGVSVEAIERGISELEIQRYQQFQLLLHFDRQLRDYIQRLVDRTQ